MNAAVLAGVLTLLLVIGTGAALTATAPRWTTTDAYTASTGRLRTAGDGLTAAFGAAGAALSVVLMGGGFMMLSLWLLGKLAHVTEPHFDVLLFEWFQARHQESGPWTSFWEFATDIGSLDLTQRTAVVAGVVFAVLFRRRRWWGPPALMFAGFMSEKLIQESLKILVDRGHPPTTLGTWPSGGCGRVLVVYGLIVYLALRWARVRSVRTWVAGWTLVAVAEAVQAYARTYNLEHWITDVFGGVLFGIMLLLTITAAAQLLMSETPARSAAPPAPVPHRAPAHAAD